MSFAVITVSVVLVAGGEAAVAVKKRAGGTIADAGPVASDTFSGCTDDSFALLEPLILLSVSDFCFLTLILILNPYWPRLLHLSTSTMLPKPITLSPSGVITVKSVLSPILIVDTFS
jgi:hypothetical protein